MVFHFSHALQQEYQHSREVLMQPEVYLNLYGSLPIIIGRKPNRMMKIPLDEPTSLSDVLSDLGIPIEKVQLVMLNHKAVRLDVTIRPGDRLALFPKEYPFFVDWYDFRNKPKPK